jgi:hypothetical protein
MTAEHLAPAGIGADAPDAGAPWEAVAAPAVPMSPPPALTPRVSRAEPAVEIAAASLVQDVEAGGMASYSAPLPAMPVVPAETQANALALQHQKALSRVSATSLAGIASRIGENAIISALENAIRVNWDTLPRLKASQGGFRNEDGIVFGEHIDVELMSWQKLWQVSPGGENNEITKKLVRYSDDGKTLNNTGEDMRAYLGKLHNAGHNKASISERVVLVFQLNAADKGRGTDAKAMNVQAEYGQLYQLGLAPSSVSTFNSHRLRQPIALAQGRITPDQAVQCRMTAIVKNNAGNEYTVVNFGYVPAN